MERKMYEANPKAIRPFEQIAPQYRGKPQAEKLFYIFTIITKQNNTHCLIPI
jgi:outer membrane protein assembly factor BamD